MSRTSALREDPSAWGQLGRKIEKEREQKEEPEAMPEAEVEVEVEEEEEEDLKQERLKEEDQICQMKFVPHLLTM